MMHPFSVLEGAVFTRALLGFVFWVMALGLVFRAFLLLGENGVGCWS